MARLAEIRIKEFLSFSDCTIRPVDGKLLIVGENGAGKSNIFRTIRFILEQFPNIISHDIYSLWNPSQFCSLSVTVELYEQQRDNFWAYSVCRAVSQIRDKSDSFEDAVLEAIKPNKSEPFRFLTIGYSSTLQQPRQLFAFCYAHSSPDSHKRIYFLGGQTNTLSDVIVNRPPLGWDTLQANDMTTSKDIYYWIQEQVFMSNIPSIQSHNAIRWDVLYQCSRLQQRAHQLSTWEQALLMLEPLENRRQSLLMYELILRWLRSKVVLLPQDRGLLATAQHCLPIITLDDCHRWLLEKTLSSSQSDQQLLSKLNAILEQMFSVRVRSVATPILMRPTKKWKPSEVDICVDELNASGVIRSMPLSWASGGVMDMILILVAMYRASSSIILLDEPGANFHPCRRYDLMQLLQRFPLSWVIITHSPEFLTEDTLPFTYRVRKTQGSQAFYISEDILDKVAPSSSMLNPNQPPGVVTSADRDRQKFLIEMLAKDFKSLFFAEGVLFVEGIDDFRVLEALNALLFSGQLGPDRKISRIRWTILPLYGCANLCRAVLFARSMNVPWSAIVDVDAVLSKGLPEDNTAWKKSVVFKVLSELKSVDVNITQVGSDFRTQLMALIQKANIFSWEVDLEDALIGVDVLQVPKPIQIACSRTWNDWQQNPLDQGKRKVLVDHLHNGMWSTISNADVQVIVRQAALQSNQLTKLLDFLQKIPGLCEIKQK